MKITIQGEWRTGKVRLAGEVLTPPCDIPLCRTHERFSWGNMGSAAGVLSLAILTRIIGPTNAFILCEPFKRDIVSQLPQLDFTKHIDIEAWVAETMRGREKGKNQRRRSR